MPFFAAIRPDIAVFEALNGVTGLSWALDSLIALALDNPLIKAGPICASFVYAWGTAGEAADVSRRRRILLVTLMSLFMIAPTSNLLSEQRLSPRPFLLSEQIYSLENGSLTPQAQVAYKAPQTGDVASRLNNLRQGEVSPNDLVSFPSDHAAFFTALSLGILIAARRPGFIALGWTLLVTLGSRVATGMHWPLDIAAGAAIGGIMLLLLLLLARGWGAAPLNRLVGWTRRHEALSAACLFLILLEAANALKTLDRLKDIAGPLSERLL